MKEVSESQGRGTANLVKANVTRMGNGFQNTRVHIIFSG